MQHLNRLVIVAVVVCIFFGIARAQSQPDEAFTAKRHKAVELFNQNRELEALPLFEELAAVNPNDSDVLLGLAAGLVSHSATVEEAQAEKERVRARELLLKAQELGNNSTLLQNLLQLLPPDGKLSQPQDPSEKAIREGEAAFARRDFDGAIKAYSRALELNPKNYSAALYIGDSYFGATNFVKAAEWYQRAIDIDPNQETAYRYYADMLTKHGEMEKARALAIQAVVADPYNAIPWRGLQQWARANQFELKLVKINVPNNVSQKDEKNVTITIDPAWPKNTAAVWLAYSISRANWRREQFNKQFPTEKQYRHTLMEEAESLSLAAKVCSELAQNKSKETNASSPPKDPDLALLLRLHQAGMIEPYVLLSAADEGIAQDYEAYRAKNRARLEEYIATFIVPPATAGSNR